MTDMQKFRALQREIHAHAHVLNLLYLDAVTAAPSDTAAERGETLAYFTKKQYELTAGDATKELIASLCASRENLTEREARELDVFRESLDYISSIPCEEYIEYQKLLNDSESVWHRAKNENDFASFAPYLEKIVASVKRFANYYKPDCDPYDVCLDQYEAGLTKKTADAFFSALREKIVPLIAEISQKPQPDNSFLFKSYPIELQRRFSDALMQTLTLDRAHCAIAETEHPFTLEFNRNDVRITTHYHEDNLASSMYSVIHEGGHALYELGSGEEYEYTCLAGGVSMGIHESQSRLFENVIGRSREFISSIYPTLLSLFPTQLSGVTPDAFYRAVNRAEPSLVRTEADELTYPLHVMVRYELEKSLMDGSLSVSDLPSAWNDKMQQYLGISVPDDTRGVLQDSHWSGGMIGYFPSYALGSAYSAQIMEKMQSELNVPELLAKGDLKPITAWLGDRLFRHGKRYTPSALLESVTGAPFDPSYYVGYLTKKLRDVYS